MLTTEQLKQEESWRLGACCLHRSKGAFVKNDPCIWKGEETHRHVGAGKGKTKNVLKIKSALAWSYRIVQFL